jgi:hypothetical protein
MISSFSKINYEDTSIAIQILNELANFYQIHHKFVINTILNQSKLWKISQLKFINITKFTTNCLPQTSRQSRNLFKNNSNSNNAKNTHSDWIRNVRFHDWIKELSPKYSNDFLYTKQTQTNVVIVVINFTTEIKIYFLA